MCNSASETDNILRLLHLFSFALRFVSAGCCCCELLVLDCCSAVLSFS